MGKRIAVIADIHGNVDALQAVLADIAAIAPDIIVNLGDHFSGPLAADETADVLLARPDVITVRGNHDRWLIEQPVDEMGSSDAIAYAKLTAEHRQWLMSLPATLTLDAGPFMCHATPSDDNTYWLETVQPDGAITARGHDEIVAHLGECSAEVVLCGHTHIPRAVRTKTGCLIVNPGSVGCPGYSDDLPVFHVMQSGFPDASYAVLDENDGWQVTFRRVSYDPSRMQQMALSAGRAEWAAALSTGWIS